MDEIEHRSVFHTLLVLLTVLTQLKPHLLWISCPAFPAENILDWLGF
jgi:hypothetical protein